MKVVKLLILNLTFLALTTSTLAFTDNSVGHKYFTSIQSLQAQNILSGYPDGTFKSGQDINRAEALKMILDSQNWETISPETAPFPDVQTNSWYAPYVHTAKEYYVIEGRPDGLFHPEETVNLAEFTKMLSQVKNLGSNFQHVDFPEDNIPLDINKNDWFYPVMKYALSKNILNIYSQNTVNPSQLMTRGYSAELIYRLNKAESDGTLFGKATFYGKAVQGNYTASGEIFDYNLMTAAHKTLPFGTKVRVKNLANGKTVEVKINDRGPYGPGRVIDLSEAAFSQIASLGAGVIYVEYDVIN